MNNLVMNIRRLPSFLAYPMIFLSSLLILLHTLALIAVDEFQLLYSYFSSAVNVLFGFSFAAFLTYYTCHYAKKAVTAGICLAASDLAFCALSGEHYSLLLMVFLSLGFAAVMNQTGLVYGYFTLLLSGLLLAVLLGFLYDYLYELLKAFAKLLAGRGALFGAVNNFYSLAFSDNFADLFYHKAYSQSIVEHGELVSGAVDIFRSDTENPKYVVSRYLTGKYFVNIFLTLGCFVALFSRLEKTVQAALTFCMLYAVIFGDVRLFSLFILLFNPLLYLAYLAVVFASYLVAGLLDLRIGFLENGSVFELFTFGNHWLYFLLTGAVLSVLSYFSVIMVLSKFDISKGRVYPREVKKLVTALGGDRNIERIKNDKLYVKNPNLIDVLKIDCDIHENVVSLLYDDLELLKEYF